MAHAREVEDAAAPVPRQEPNDEKELQKRGKSTCGGATVAWKTSTRRRFNHVHAARRLVIGTGTSLAIAHEAAEVSRMKRTPMTRIRAPARMRSTQRRTIARTRLTVNSAPDSTPEKFLKILRFFLGARRRETHVERFQRVRRSARVDTFDGMLA